MARILISDKFTFGKLVRFALPSITMVIFTSLYGVVDGFCVSNFAGNDAFVAVNLFLPIFYLLGSMGMLLGSGGCALIAKLFGEKREEYARKLFSALVIVTSAIALVFTAIFIVFMPRLAVALGADEHVLPHCVRYGYIMLAGLLPFTLQSFFQYFFAVADRPKPGLVITVAAGVTNIIGDFVLIYGFSLGVTGAAVATVLGELVGSVIPLVFFAVPKGKKLFFAAPEFEAGTLGKICVNGSSELLSCVSTSLVNMLYNFQLLRYVGKPGVTAFGVIMYISFIFVGCYLGFAVGTTPIVGYNYGAENRAEMKSVFRKSLGFIALAAGVLTALAEALAVPLATVFVEDAELVELSARALGLFSVSFIISGFNIYASAFFTALNNGAVSAIISTLRTLVFQVAAVFVMPLLFGVDGIWCATIAAEALSFAVATAMILRYRKRYGYM